MNYILWTGDELRYALGANPRDLDAMLEAAARFERVAKTDAEFDALQEKIDELQCDLDDARAEAQGYHDDYDAERKRALELQQRVDELEDAGAGLL